MKLTKLSFILAVLCLAVFGQTNVMTPTTLSSAVALQDSVINVTSASGFVAPGYGTAGSLLLIDNEVMAVQSISSTAITVSRGVGGPGVAASSKAAHVSGAYVWYGAPNLFLSKDMSGGCITAKLFVHPVINLKTGVIWGCYGSDGAGAVTGQWKVMLDPNKGDTAPFGRIAGLNRYSNILNGGTAWASVGTTLSVTPTVTYVASIDLPVGKLVTGVSYLAGTTNSGTPHATVALFGPNGGKPIAYSATQAVTATASIWEDVAFTKVMGATGTTGWLPPGRYFVGLQTDASTSHITTINTGSQPVDLVTTSITGGTYGTINVSLTAPTTYTTAVGPVVALY